MFDLNAIVSAALNAAVQQAVAPLVERIAALEFQSADRHQRLLVLEGALTDRVVALEGAISHKVQIQQANITAALAERVAALESAVDKANLAKFIEEELIASLAVTDIVGEDRVAQIESRIAALENNPAIGVGTALGNQVQCMDTDMTALKDRIAALEGASSVLASQYTPISNEQFKAMLEEWDIGRLVQRITALETETQGENRYLNRNEVNDLIQEAMDEHTSTYDHDDYDSHVSDDDKHFDGDIEDAVRDALSNMTFDVSIR